MQFSVRTVFRSAQHRVILAFYWGIAFALVIIFVKSPGGQQFAEFSLVRDWLEMSVPLLVSSMVMMAFAVLAGRLAFAMPVDLKANWIFRVMPVRDGRLYTSARRRALVILSAAPVWTAWAIALFWLWPWQPALGHLVALAFLGLILVEIALIEPVKIPCTCSYLPGKSHVHLAVFAACVLLLPAIFKAAAFERDALQDLTRYAAMLAGLCATWIGLRWRSAVAQASQPTFDDEPIGRAVTLELWDSRAS